MYHKKTEGMSIPTGEWNYLLTNKVSMVVLGIYPNQLLVRVIYMVQRSF